VASPTSRLAATLPYRLRCTRNWTASSHIMCTWCPGPIWQIALKKL
jgi:hypothetical protein